MQDQVQDQAKRYSAVAANFHDGQVIPAIPLCLDETRSFDEIGQRKLIRYYLEAGVGGIAVAVHTTQFEIRDPEINLFETILEVTADEIAKYEEQSGRLIIKVAGVCGETQQAVAEAEVAKRLSYDFALLSIGGLAALTEAELIKRTEAVSAVMPVIAFSMQPAVGGRFFSPAYWAEIVSIPNVIGIKAAPFNRYETIQIARAVALSKRSEPLTLYSGNDDNIVVDLLTPYVFKDENGEEHEVEIKGGLLGHWSVWTEAAVELFAELKEIRVAKSETIPRELLTRAAWVTEANGAVFDAAHNFEGVIAGVHQALVDDGLMQGIWTLNPEETLSPGQLEAIRRAARDYPTVTVGESRR